MCGVIGMVNIKLLKYYLNIKQRNGWALSKLSTTHKFYLRVDFAKLFVTTENAQPVLPCSLAPRQTTEFRRCPYACNPSLTVSTRMLSS